MRKINTLFIMTAVALLPAACGKDDEKPNSAPYGFFEREGLSGRWETGCVQGQGDRPLARVRGWTMLGDDMVQVSRQFDDDACAAGALRSEWSESYGDVFLLKQPRIEGWKSVDHAVRAVTLTLHSDQLVAIYNRNKFYGLDGWRLGQPRDITGLVFAEGEAAEAKAGDAFILTVLVEDDKLLQARYADGQSLRSDEPQFVFTRK